MLILSLMELTMGRLWISIQSQSGPWRIATWGMHGHQSRHWMLTHLHLGHPRVSIWALDRTPFWLWMDRNLGSQPKPLMALNRSQSERSIKVGTGWSQIWDMDGSNYWPCNAPSGLQRSPNRHSEGSQPGEYMDINVGMR